MAPGEGLGGLEDAMVVIYICRHLGRRPVDWLKRGSLFLIVLGGLKGAEMADAGT